MFLILIEIKASLTLSLSAGVHLTHLCVEVINAVACVPGEKEQLGERKAQLQFLGKDGNLERLGAGDRGHSCRLLSEGKESGMGEYICLWALESKVR